MVDIESFGPQPGGNIIQIAAVSFEFGSVSEPIEILENADRHLNLYPLLNGACDTETMAWWAQPENKAALDSIGAAPKLDVRECLRRLSSFVNSYLGKGAMIWAKPPGYDLKALADLYRRNGMEAPWHFRQEACLRTIAWLADKVPPKKFMVPDLSAKGLVARNALHDCVAQAILAQAAHRALVLDLSGK
jgi:hypothetical protein